MKLKATVLILVLLSWSWILAGKTMAAEGLNLTLSPLPINLTADPGSVVTTQLKVKNGGSADEQIKVGLMKFQAFGNEGKPRLLDREGGDDYFDWVSFSPSEFNLTPNEWKTIEMKITVPETAAFGYYYAVTFSRKSSEIEGNVGTKIVGATASLVLLEVRSPNAIRKVELTDFSVSKGVFEFLPAEFTIKLKNSGNVHVVPKGNVFISQGGKKDIGVLIFNENFGNILPDSYRNFSSSWQDAFPVYMDKVEDGEVLIDKKGKNIKELKWDFSQVQKLRFGKYRATLLLAYDDGQRDVPLEASVNFWVIPWRIMAGALVIFLLVLTGIVAIIKVIMPKKVKK